MARKIKHVEDKFYTKPNVILKINNYIDFNNYDLIIEPSAGNGSFLPLIKNYNYIALDINPENDKIIKMDWFDFSLDKEYKSILVIGNPPFGNQSKLAFKFIKKASELNVNTIAFILPKSFKKHTLQNRIPLNYHLSNEIDLEDNSFLLNGLDYSVPCIFQIWNKKEELRDKVNLPSKTEYFEFVKKTDNPDLSFRRVGFNAGNVFDNISEKSEQSHYFIKNNNLINLDKLKQFLINLDWEHNNTAGPRSIGKGELIVKFEDEIKKTTN